MSARPPRRWRIVIEFNSSPEMALRARNGFCAWWNKAAAKFIPDAVIRVEENTFDPPEPQVRDSLGPQADCNRV